MSTTHQELIKATDSLKISVNLLKKSQINERDNIELHKALRDSCLQRFKFCIELSWKTSIKILGLQTKAPKPAIREMAQNNLILNPQIWFDFLEARNKTSHSYDEDVAQSVYLEIEKVIPELEVLIEKLKLIS